MKLGIFASAALLAATLASAQDKSKTRIIVEEGKDTTLTGCVQRNADGGYTLTNAAGKNGASASYILARLDDEDEFEKLKDHVNHRVEIAGKAADKGDGRIKVVTDSGKTETKSEMKGDLSGMPFLGVKDLRMIASVCP
jgi:hypothetical protein